MNEISPAQLTSAKLRSAELTPAELASTELASAKFTHAELIHAELTHAEIHAKALDVACRHRHSVCDTIEILQILDLHKTYRAYDCPSLYKYAVQYLKLSEDTAVNYIAIARKSVEVPALKQKIKEGTISTSKARAICPVLTVENQGDWLELASTLTSSELQKEVAEVEPKAAVSERLTYVTGERLRLVVGVSEEFQAKLKRAQDLVSNSLQAAASYEQTLEAALDLFLERRDPVRKAKRNALKTAAKDAAMTTTLNVSETDGAQTKAQQMAQMSGDNPPLHVTLRIKPEFLTRRKPPTAKTKHTLTLRDQDHCTHRDDQGNRCSQTRWLDRHHRIPVSQGGDNSVENLVTLCGFHHKIQHKSGF